MKIKLDFTTIALAALLLYLYDKNRKRTITAQAAAMSAENRVKTPVSFLAPVQTTVPTIPGPSTPTPYPVNGVYTFDDAYVHGIRHVKKRVL